MNPAVIATMATVIVLGHIVLLIMIASRFTLVLVCLQII
jgi:hypothetical protein